ncbi:MAG: hypothetical protein ACRCWJ_05010 [Casimicrobium sp.]
MSRNIQVARFSRRCDVDIDGDKFQTTADGVLASRLSAGIVGATLVNGVQFSLDATRNTWPKIRNFLRDQCDQRPPWAEPPTELP